MSILLDSNVEFEYVKYATTTLFSIITFIMTILIYRLARKITLNKTVKEKQLEVTLDLITELSKVEMIQ